jgi:hypothetical protein
MLARESLQPRLVGDRRIEESDLKRAVSGACIGTGVPGNSYKSLCWQRESSHAAAFSR